MSMKLIQGDSLEVMKTLPDNSVDAVVTDPPYGLKFMGKKWDYNVPTVEQWKEVYRVMKPGAFLLSFGGTRTYHRMVVNIEDAGFEIRDQLQWIYGCLSEDTEILTVNGWERYHKTIDKCLVCSYNIDKDSFEFQMPKRSFIYENKHTAYRIQSDKTDQIVSRNHRVLVERSGKLTFCRAEKLQPEENIPFLESLSDLPEAIYGDYQRAGSEKQRLQRMCQGQNGKMEQRKEAEENNLPCLQERILPNRPEQGKAKKVLFGTMQWKRKSKNPYKIFRQWKGEETSGDGIKREGKPSLEGWCNLFQKTRELCSNKICQMSEGILNHVSQRRLCYGTPSCNGSIVGQEPSKKRGSPSYQPQSTGQQDRKPDVIPNEQSTQNIRRTRATITPIEYHGKVWCIEVPSGAFVARRNGKIFITGNSGFPKSLDIGKAIDRAAGVKRIKVASGNPVKRMIPGADQDKTGSWIKDNGRTYQPGEEIPATPKAIQWDGWGTALKPANEPICLARKPLSEKTVAANVLRWGCGGLNIDKCRVMPYNDCVVGHNQKEAQDDNPESYRGSIGKENSKRNNNGDLPDLPERVQDLEKLPEAQKEPAHLFKGMPSKEHDGAEEFQLEGRSLGLQEDGIQPLEGGYTPGKRQETVIEPGCETSAGTQNDNGSTPNEAVEKNRNGSSYQRGQEGQPNRESLHIGLDKSRERTSENNERNGSSETGKRETQKTPTGRFPANVILDGSDEVVGLFPDSKSTVDLSSHAGRVGTSTFAGEKQVERIQRGDSGSAARFFYVAKASKAERNKGLDSTLTVKYNIPKTGGVLCEEVTVAVQLLQKVMSEQGLVSFSIGESGESIMALCHRDSLSTILTETNRIIESKTLPLWMPSLINESTLVANSGMVNGGNPVANVGNLRKWLLTITKENLELVRGASNVALQMLLLINEKGNWQPFKNTHSTVKHLKLMRYLCRLVTPPGGKVLDCYVRSGTTGVAAQIEGFEFIGIDKDIDIATRRIEDTDPLFQAGEVMTVENMEKERGKR